MDESVEFYEAAGFDVHVYEGGGFAFVRHDDESVFDLWGRFVSFDVPAPHPRPRHTDDDRQHRGPYTFPAPTGSSD